MAKKYFILVVYILFHITALKFPNLVFSLGFERFSFIFSESVSFAFILFCNLFYFLIFASSQSFSAEVGAILIFVVIHSQGLGVLGHVVSDFYINEPCIIIFSLINRFF